MPRMIAKIFRRAALTLRGAVLGMYMRAARALFGIDRNKVVLSSFKGAAYSDSPRAIAEALHEARPGTDIVFQLRKGAQAPSWVRRAKPNSLRWLYEISTARVIVDNFNRPFYQKKFPGQKYIQTWHGDRGFKRVLFDKDPNGGYPDSGYIDLAVAGSDFAEGMFRSAFRYQGEILKVGAAPQRRAFARAGHSLREKNASRFPLTSGFCCTRRRSGTRRAAGTGCFSPNSTCARQPRNFPR